MQSEIMRNTILIAGANASLDLVSDDGEILAVIPVPEGRHKATRYLDLQGPGQMLQVGQGVIAFQPTNRIGLIDFGSAKFESAANPEFRVTNAQRSARDFELRLRKMEIMQQRIHRAETIQNRVSDTEEETLIEKELSKPDAEPQQEASE